MLRRAAVIPLCALLAGGAACPAFAQSPDLPAIVGASDGAPGDAFGRAVAFDGDTLVVGAPGHDARGADAGAVYVFARGSGGAWIETQKLLPVELLAGDTFGWSVAVDDDLIVAGAPGDRRVNSLPSDEAAARGAAYVYRRVNGAWSHEARLQPDDLVGGDRFGFAVAVAAGTAFIGAPFKAERVLRQIVQEVGAVYVATRSPSVSPSSWVTGGLETRNPSNLPAWIGAGLSSERDRLVVGRPRTSWPPSLAAGQAQTHRRDVGSRWYVDDDDVSLDYFLHRSAPVRAGAGLEARLGGAIDIAATSDGARLAGNSYFRATPFPWFADVAPGGAVSGVQSPGSSSPATALAVAGDERWWSIGHRVALTEATADPKWAGYASLAFPPSGETGSLDGRGDEARFVAVRAIDAVPGLAFLIDTCAVRRVDADMTVTTLAGAVQQCGEHADGVGSAARFVSPLDLAVAGGSVYVADGTAIRRLDLATGAVTVLAGLPGQAFAEAHVDGPAAVARFRQLRGIAFGFGVLYVADGGTVRRVTTDGHVTTLAGDPAATLGRLSIPVDGQGASARLSPARLAVVGPGRVWAIELSGLVRQVTDAGDVTTVAGWTESMMPAGRAGYSVDMARFTVAVGVPAGSTPLSATRTGAAVIASRLDGRLVEAAWPRDAREGDRYGAAVALLDDNVLALGAANGPLWVEDDAVAPADDQVEPVVLFWQPGRTLWRQWTRLPVPAVSPTSGYGSALAASGTEVAVGAPRDAAGRVFVYDLATVDADHDTLPDLWELSHGLDPTSAEPPTGASGDPDGDGSTNAAEFAARSHPLNDPRHTRYFAEGATSSFFDTEFALANPGAVDARVLLRFLTADQRVTSHSVMVPARTRRTITVADVPGLTGAEYATVVESDQFVGVDRLMSWHDTTPAAPNAQEERAAYGSHGQSGVEAPATAWWLAEGATGPGFDLFYLLQNPGDTEAEVRIRYLLADDDPVEQVYRVAARSRRTIWVNLEELPAGSGRFPLAGRELSAEITSVNGVPVLVERAMYRTRQGAPFFEAGQGSAGITAPATEWFLAEGATGPFFDLFVLVANPGATPSEVEARFLLPDGTTLIRNYLVGAGRRVTVWVDHEDARLADTAVSTVVRSTNGVPVIVERAMWWPGSPATWSESHASPGATGSGLAWVGAAGRLRQGVAGLPDIQTYYLIANPGDQIAYVSVTVLPDDGGPPMNETVVVAPHSRVNVVAVPPGGGPVNGLIELPSNDARFSMVFLAQTPVVVEWAIYGDTASQGWAAGANSLASRLP